MSLTAGQTLSFYEILGSLGAGGMGEVYRARDTRLEREVALKVLPQEFTGDEDRLRRFEREARTLASLSHAHVGAIFSVDQVDDTCFITLELIEGEDLSTRLSRGALPVAEALDICCQIADGLEAAHEADVVHRDLKPANVRITHDGTVKILDFGLAKPVGPKAASGDGDSTTKSEPDSFLMTEQGLVLGTPTYMSPEQARGKLVDRRTDVWAFGCVLYECLTSVKPFAGESVTDILAAIVDREPDLSPLPANMPPRVVELLERCLDKEPRERLRDIGEARVTLSRAGRELGRPQQAAAGTEGPSGRAVGHGLLVFPVVLLLGVVLGWFAGGGGSTISSDAGDTTFSTSAVKVRPLTFSGNDSWPRVSPNGRTLAFVSTRDGRPRIWVKPVAGGAEVVLTDGPDRDPRFSADGEWLHFVRGTGDSPSIMRVPSLGGPPRTLVRDAIECDPSPDSTRIAFLRQTGDPAAPHPTLWVARFDGSDPRQLYDAPGRLLGGVQWSPDGRRIAVVEGPTMNFTANRILLVDAETGDVTDVEGVPADSRISNLSFSGAGEELVYASLSDVIDDLAPDRIVAHDLDTGVLRDLLWERETMSQVGIARDGTLVFATAMRRQNLCLASPDQGAGRNLTFGSSVDRQPVVSPDGKTALFSSSRSGNLDLWSVSLETGELLRITDDEEPDWDPAFSPDGTEILWSSRRSGNLEIWSAAPDGSGARQITHDGVDAQNPTMTSDGWIVYSTSNPAHIGLHRIRSDGSEDSLIRPGNCTLPEVSPDGRHVLYLNQTAVGSRGNLLRVVELATGEPVDFEIDLSAPEDARFGSNYGRARWLLDGSGVACCAADESGQWGLVAFDFAPGEAPNTRGRLLVDLGPGTVIESFGFLPDGSGVVVSEFEMIQTVLLAENVPGVLRPKAE